MDILKSAIDWAKAELFQHHFHLFGVVFMVASLSFWQLGKTEIAKAYIIPTLVAGALLLIIGLGLFLQIKQESHNLNQPIIQMPRLLFRLNLSEQKIL